MVLQILSDPVCSVRSAADPTGARCNVSEWTAPLRELAVSSNATTTRDGHHQLTMEQSGVTTYSCRMAPMRTPSVLSPPAKNKLFRVGTLTPSVRVKISLLSSIFISKTSALSQVFEHVVPYFGVPTVMGNL